ncbi:MAG: hypothetical protein ABH883_01940 [Candidatus Omnitrophota bacterium]
MIERNDFEMDKDTLTVMLSPYSQTRLELAIYHALAPMIRIPVNYLSDKINFLNQFLQSA